MGGQLPPLRNDVQMRPLAVPLTSPLRGAKVFAEVAASSSAHFKQFNPAVMQNRQLPPLWQWNLIYLRLAIRRVASLKALAGIAELTEHILHTLRTELGVEWVKPMRRFEGMLKLPDFAIQFLDAAEKEGLLDPPASPVPWAPRLHVPGTHPEPPSATALPLPPPSADLPQTSLTSPPPAPPQ